ncbi:MAG: diacylglycerol kinase family protein [Candidatus Paceibacterota bacterium]
MKEGFSFKKLINSFTHAFSGLRIAYFGQNFRLMIALVLIVFLLGILFKISYEEWLILVLVIGFILTLEILNTFFEELLDILEPDYSKKIKVIKDLSSAAVLMMSLTAFILGIIIFLFKIFQIFKS